ncbi:hypothetical protein POM88_047631 [Heracleum sosnowskyi]|uniref:NIM1-interacting protein n=1 Tax=Heracleum sosnowskyi TaxID=360622 RepID=A0AAD8LXR4_9APIA|nr:hypothetical protein POM88_047631 [Heracleum sosnowskyi]
MEEQKKYSGVFESKVDKIEDDEEEEEEVDKFISLIKKFREARNRRINELNELTATTTDDMRKRRKIWNRNQEFSGWIPTFEMQDFNVSQVSASNCKSKSNHRNDKEEGRKEENDGEGSELDLKLAL